MEHPVWPPSLKDGSVIGVVSPSSPVSSSMLAGTVEYWESRGYAVSVGDNAAASLGGYLAGSAEQRAHDVNAMLRDESIDLIVASMGGKGGAQLLPLLDYEALRAHPKQFMGLSDSSILSTALHAKTNVVTYHGPTGVNFGELGVPVYTEAAMFAALTGVAPSGALPKFSTWETLRGSSPRTGRLLGGHLGTIRALIGTPYEPEWQGSVLFIEEVAVEFHDIDAALTHFRLAGILDKIGALVVGRCVEVEERSFPSSETLNDVLLRLCDGFQFPIVTNVDLGHTDEKVTLPIGADVTLVPASADLVVESWAGG